MSDEKIEVPVELLSRMIGTINKLRLLNLSISDSEYYGSLADEAKALLPKPQKTNEELIKDTEYLTHEIIYCQPWEEIKKRLREREKS